MAKHGEPREQYNNSPAPETIMVINDNFDGVIMTINKDQFDAAYMKRCNEHGQMLDERGRVMLESIPKSQMAPSGSEPKAPKDEAKKL